VFSPTSKVAAEVDVRRLDLDAEPQRLGAKFELVGVVEFERHRRRQELHRIMRLHVGGVIGHQRVSRRVALVEAVVGEFGEQFEDRVGLPFGTPFLTAPATKTARCFSISARIFLPIARRSRSASPSE
jgi:hypothetical protein